MPDERAWLGFWLDYQHLQSNIIVIACRRVGGLFGASFYRLNGRVLRRHNRQESYSRAREALAAKLQS